MVVSWSASRSGWWGSMLKSLLWSLRGWSKISIKCKSIASWRETVECGNCAGMTIGAVWMAIGCKPPVKSSCWIGGYFIVKYFPEKVLFLKHILTRYQTYKQYMFFLEGSLPELWISICTHEFWFCWSWYPYFLRFLLSSPSSIHQSIN